MHKDAWLLTVNQPAVTALRNTMRESIRRAETRHIACAMLPAGWISGLSVGDRSTKEVLPIGAHRMAVRRGQYAPCVRFGNEAPTPLYDFLPPITSHLSAIQARHAANIPHCCSLPATYFARAVYRKPAENHPRFRKAFPDSNARRILCTRPRGQCVFAASRRSPSCTRYLPAAHAIPCGHIHLLRPSRSLVLRGQNARRWPALSSLPAQLPVPKAGSVHTQC